MVKSGCEVGNSAEHAVVFCWPLRIYYEDTDHGGVVYYANYLKFMERCRTEMLRASGVEQDQLINHWDLIFAVRRVEVDYLAPAKFNDQLIVTARMVGFSGVRMIFKQSVFRRRAGVDKVPASFVDYDGLREENELLCDAEITIVSLSATKLRPKRVPGQLFEELRRER